MGRTSRIALIALVTATALGGCGGTETDIPPELQDAVKAAETNADFCTAAQANVDAGAALTAFSTAAPPPRPANEIKAVLEPVRESNARMLASAPEVAKADLQLVTDLAELKLAAYEANGGDPVAASQDPAVVEKTATATEPSARIRQYLRAVCRIAPN